jgi:hypothetical protein
MTFKFAGPDFVKLSSLVVWSPQTEGGNSREFWNEETVAEKKHKDY